MIGFRGWWMLQHRSCMEVGVPFFLVTTRTNTVLMSLLHLCQLISTFKTILQNLFLTRLDQQSSNVVPNLSIVQTQLHWPFIRQFVFLLWQKLHVSDFWIKLSRKGFYLFKRLFYFHHLSLHLHCDSFNEMDFCVEVLCCVEELSRNVQMR